MSQFFNIVHKEFQINGRRVSVWIMAVLVTLFYVGTEIAPFFDGSAVKLTPDQVWPAAALTVFKLNLFFPLVGGILAADRLSRDYRLGVDELRESTPVKRASFVFAKYLGVVAVWLVPELICLVMIGLIPILGGLVGWAYLPAILVSGLAMNLPALLFVTAFSLACPMVMPVRVYQVLFTGYWFWGNFLSPDVLPTISNTILNASGFFSLQAFFSGVTGPEYANLAFAAICNIVVLLLMSVGILTVLLIFLDKKMKKA